MSLPKFLAPPSEVTRFETGLTFTDILFGFVIFEIFTRLQHWGQLSWVVRWQLIAAITLVLGSWIGFRRSRNRSRYELKFFNLPLLRFLLDQAMVVFYFRVATLTPTTAPFVVSAPKLAHKTTLALLIVLVLYVLWDVGAFLMFKAGPDNRPVYPKINEDTNAKIEGSRATRDLRGLCISVVAAALIAGLFFLFDGITVHTQEAEDAFIAATVILLAYRWAKEIRSSYR